MVTDKAGQNESSYIKRPASSIAPCLALRVGHVTKLRADTKLHPFSHKLIPINPEQSLLNNDDNNNNNNNNHSTKLYIVQNGGARRTKFSRVILEALGDWWLCVVTSGDRYQVTVGRCFRQNQT